MYKILQIFSTLFIAFTATTASAQTQIFTLADLDNIKNNLSGDYVLMNDIDASATSDSSSPFWNGGAGWDPIGDSGNGFTGTFDGQGYTISNLFIDRDTTSYVGLFAYTQFATVTNLNLENVNITGANFTGGLAGWTNNDLTDITVSGVINGADDVGGIVGSLNQFNSEDLVFSGDVSGTNRVGGVAGGAGGNFSVLRASSAGTVSGAEDVGGMIGFVSDGTLQEALSRSAVTGTVNNAGGAVGFVSTSLAAVQVGATGGVTGAERVGGLIGSGSDLFLSNCYAAGAVSGTGIYAGGMAGLIAGSSSSIRSYWDEESTGQTIGPLGDPRTTDDMTAPYNTGNTYQLWDFSTTWTICENINGGYPYFQWQSLQPDGPIEIATLEQLALIGSGSCYPMNWDYVLVADIDASPTSDSSSPFWNGGAGWDPIGDNTNRFTGTFDGQGFTISNLTINRINEREVGLFGFVEGANLSNINFSNASVSGKFQTGVLAGSSISSTVSNIDIEASVTVNFDFGQDAGALIGFGIGGSFDRISASGSVSPSNPTTRNALAGGLIGSIRDNATIQNSFSSVDVAGYNGVGGLVGQFVGNTQIINCYATGNVTGNNHIGGLVGLGNNSTITNSYSTGAVSGSSNIGGLVGQAVTVNNSYWNTETSGQATSAGGTGLTTEQMTFCPDSAAYAGWDFGSVWAIHPDVNGGYPFLRWENLATGPIEIATLEELSLIGSLPCYPLDGDYVLVADIDASPTSDSSSPFWNGGAGWAPIGNFFNFFSGTLDGQGHTIDGLFVDRQSSEDVGLFGFVSGGTIENLTLSNANVTGNLDVGILLGEANGGSTIRNVSVTGSATAVRTSGSSPVGGIGGRLENSLIERCSADTTVSGNRAGGIAGGGSFITLRESIARGNVNGTPAPSTFAGGLIAEFTGLGGNLIERSVSHANVTSPFTAAGLVSDITSSLTIRDSYATGSVMGFEAAGILSTNASSSLIIEDVYFSGTLTGSNRSGILEADFGTATITSSYWDTDISGVFSSVGGTGLTTAQMTTPPYSGVYTGWDFGTTWAICPNRNGGYPYLRWQGTDSVGPFEIDTFDDLTLIGSGGDCWPNFADYALVNDIDASPSAALNGGQGMYRNIGYSVTLDGQGHTISDLKVVSGFFPSTSGGGSTEIRNLRIDGLESTGGSENGGLIGNGGGNILITNVHITNGSVFGWDVIAGGGFVGAYSGSLTISDSSFQGLVAGYGTFSDNIGGLVGRVRIGGSLTIQRSWVSGEISGRDNIGGLVGYNDTGFVTIEDSYAFGTTTASRGPAGGVAGFTYDSNFSSERFWLRRSYSRMAVTAQSNAGGLAGTSYYSEFTDSFAMGPVSASSGNQGGLIAVGSSNAMNSSFWNTETTGQTGSSGGGTGLTTAQMTTLPYSGVYTGWDFANTWQADTTGINNGYPYHQWFTERATLQYSADTGGSISGEASQTRVLGADGGAVEAIANSGWAFDQWSDGVTDNPRTDLGVTEDIAVTALFTDIEPPTSAAQPFNPFVVGSFMSGSVASSDNVEVANYDLWYRLEGGGWDIELGSVPPTSNWNIPALGSGRHFIQAIARDTAGNVEAGPSGNGDAVVIVNLTPNGALTLSIPAGDPVTTSFPMEDDVLVTITLNNVTAPGTLTVSRTEGDVFPAGFADGFQFAGFSVDIDAGGGLAFDDAIITLDYEESEMDFPEGIIDQAWSDDAGTVNTHPITIDTDNDLITVENVTGFSTWYFGNSAGLPVELDAFTVE